MKRHKLGLIALLFLACTPQQVAPIKTVDDIAHEACQAAFARSRGISLEQAAQLFCTGEEALRPFIQSLKAAERTAELRAMQREEKGQ